MRPGNYCVLGEPNTTGPSPSPEREGWTCQNNETVGGVWPYWAKRRIVRWMTRCQFIRETM
jgi:hypothetical protein